MEENIYCIYHSKDWDGVMSAAIVKAKHPTVKLIGYDYGDPSVISQIQPNSLVFVVDVSLPDEEMLILDRKCYLRWFDHHKTAMEKESLKNIKGCRSYAGAGCLLTFDHLFSYSSYPLAIKMLSDYDTWNQSDAKKWDTQILPFQYGMRQFPLDPNLPILQQLIEGKKRDTIAEQILEEGKAILRYEKNQAATYCKKFAFDYTFKIGDKYYDAICVNRQMINSTFVDSVFDEEKHDLIMYYAFDGKVYRYSVYSRKGGVDVSEIAKFYGGGGHKHAAGFKLEKPL